MQPPLLPLVSRLLSAWNCVLCLMFDGCLASARAGGRSVGLGSRCQVDQVKERDVNFRNSVGKNRVGGTRDEPASLGG